MEEKAQSYLYRHWSKLITMTLLLHVYTRGSPITRIFLTSKNRLQYRNLLNKWFLSSPITRLKTAALEGNLGYNRIAL